ncbi:MAG: GDP-mannose 4,6-dehydratase [Candidatus Omnitrophica bacterium]|nr:GDP-mannose 4,6-dehydratase [Candidatus Omnitrophota bacterium]
MPRCFITGITGQDGSYLSELLLEKGYEVHGLVRRHSSLGRSRISHLISDADLYDRRLFLHTADFEDPLALRRVLVKVQPDEIYHLAGQSDVGLSFEMAESTCRFTALATLELLEMFRDLPHTPRLFHASSSEIFGQPAQAPQDEQCPVAPVNPYGCAKAFATQLTTVYRRSFGVFASNGILYNHESPRRGENFVTRKICRAAAAIKLGRQTELRLGNMEAKRDWGHARDYVRGMWLALQYSSPGDFVFATGQLHTVQDVVEVAFASVQRDWREYVRQDPSLIRTAETGQLVGNPAKAKRLLGWEPQTGFREMIVEMTKAELEAMGDPH